MTAVGTESRVEEHRLPGELGMWMFVLGDMIVFGIFFATFLYYRSFDVAGYNQAQAELSVSLGVANTLLLLAGSLFVVWALDKARQSDFRGSTRLLGSAIACGFGFVAIKYIEYSDKLANDITIVTNEFFMYYFMYTGIHLVHVLLGIGLLAYLFVKTSSETVEIRMFEVGGIFWHMVDLLWIMLFPLLYLVS